MDLDKIIAEIECLERTFAMRTRDRWVKRRLGRKSTARPDARRKPVVSAMATVWHLLPLRLLIARGF
jgi:hypothetical protein